MNAKRLILGLVCAVPLAGLAEPSAVRPGNKGEARVSTEAKPAEGEGARRRVADRMKDWNPSPAEIAAGEAFIEKHSPNRFKAYKSMLATGPRPFLRKSVVRGYLEMQAVENEDPALYDLKLDEMRLEDKIFGVVLDAREKGGIDRERVREEVRPMVKDLVAKRKEETALRLERLKEATQKEQARLDELNSTGNDWIEQRINEELKRTSHLLPTGEGRTVNRKVNGPTTASD